MIRIMDIIEKKQHLQELTEQEIRFFVEGVTDGSIPDYQITALLMAVYFNGMTNRETALLAQYMARSGDMIDLSGIDGIKADKHSTGGVGDKTTLVVAPIVAACGVKVAKMSGRGLGFTGGTLDKLESIPGMRLSLDKNIFFSVVNSVGVSVIGQTGNICPADKKLYALRDVTSTVESIPLIASSIMSKKLAAGSDVILLDVKVGSGAFMKTKERAIDLAKQMVDIGEAAGRRTAALLTNMDIPLGRCIGNSLEVIEAVDTLRGNGPDDLTRICIALAANMLALAKGTAPSECIPMAEDAIDDGRAYQVFKNMVAAQGGDVRVIEDTELFEKAPLSYAVKAAEDGYVVSMDAQKCGMAAGILGAGRMTKDSAVDYSAGIVLHKKTGDYVQKGGVVATVYSSNESALEQGAAILADSIAYGVSKPDLNDLILGRVDVHGVHTA